MFFKYLKIFNIDNTKLIRVGPPNDGGYVVSKEHSKNLTNVLSFGIDNNIDFEIKFNQIFKPKRTLLFDHTINKLPKKTKFFFFKKGLSIKKNLLFTTLDDETKNFKDNKNFLKIDIEYDEFKVFDNVDIEILKKFSQIICEFHFIFLDKDDVNSKKNLTPYFEKFMISNYEKINILLAEYYERVLKKINKNFIPFHMHANNSLPLKKIFGRNLPQLLEISFLRKDLVKKKRLSLSKYPIDDLDLPNKPYKKDLTNFYPFS
jgi:hypothetical protein